MIFQPGNLPVVWYREIFPGSRVIGRTVRVSCQTASLFVQTYYSALFNQAECFFVRKNLLCAMDDIL